MVTQGIGGPISVSSTVKALIFIITFVIIGIVHLFSCLHLIVSAYLALVEFEEADDLSKPVGTSQLNADNLATLQLQLALQETEAIATQSHAPHAVTEIASSTRCDQQIADAMDVLSEVPAAYCDSGYEETLAYERLPYPLPENGLEWSELIAESVDWGRVRGDGPERKNGRRIPRTIGWEEVYNRFDFSASQLIDLDLDIDQQ